MYERSRPDKPDTDPGDGDDPGTAFDDRAVKLSTTLGGAGIIHGALTPECAEFVRTVLDALSAPSGADDDRSHDQRYHDALHEAMRRLMAGGLVPQRSGAPLRVWAYIPLGDLMRLPGSAELVAQWAAQLHARWAGQRAAAAEEGGHQGLWLDGDAAKGIACGAPVTPVITGDLDPAALGDLIRLCAQLDELQHGPREPGQDTDADCGGTADDDGSDAPAGTDRSRQALVQAIIGKAVELLSRARRARLVRPPRATRRPGEPGRDDDGVEQGQEQGAPQPRAARPGRVARPA